MPTVFYVALFIGAAVLIGNIVYDKKINRPIQWGRTIISTAVVIALTFLMNWAGENLADFGSK